METPDKWVVISINDEIYKVLAGWYGGYGGSNSWRINSGIVSYEKDNNFYYFYGHSGSVYKCHVDAQGLTGVTASIFHYLQELEEGVKIVTNFEEVINAGIH